MAAPAAKPLARPRTEEDRIQLEPLGAGDDLKAFPRFPPNANCNEGVEPGGELNPGFRKIYIVIWRFRHFGIQYRKVELQNSGVEAIKDDAANILGNLWGWGPVARSKKNFDSACFIILKEKLTWIYLDYFGIICYFYNITLEFQPPYFFGVG